MKDSNYTLRWNRTSREAYGHTIQLEDHPGDKLVGILSAFIAGFLLAMVIFT